MGKPTGFMEFPRKSSPVRDALVRLGDWYEIYESADEKTLKQQGARCMDCGVPFCHSETGCPIDNLIPEFNDLVYQNRWEEAYERLSRTNNFPEFTGRVCPAPCESACVLGIHSPAVTIKSIECAIIDRAFEEGWLAANAPAKRTGKKVAVIGSGPAGLAAADQLNKAGHSVTVFERDDRIGGLLMYGIPNMKLDKRLVQRRVDLLEAEGVTFKVNHNIGGDVSDQGEAKDAKKIAPETLLKDFDAVILATGALKARMLDLPGKKLAGIHRAMEYLHQNTRSLLDSGLVDGKFINAKGKHVVIIGGGDTGTDCIATALRHGATSVTNITRREQEPSERDQWHAWPGEAGTYYIDYGHAEGIAKHDRDPREYGVQPMEFVGANGKLTGIKIVRLQWATDPATGKQTSTVIAGSEEVLPCDILLLSAGFTGSDTPALFKTLGVTTDRNGLSTAKYGDYQTNVAKVFAAGDSRRGASLVVWGIAEGRGAARAVDTFLMGSSTLPAPDMAGQLSSAG